MKAKPEERKSFIIGEKTHRIIKKAAFHEEMTMRDYVEEAIAYYVEHRKQQAQKNRETQR
jgi:hypothetical protein